MRLLILFYATLLLTSCNFGVNVQDTYFSWYLNHDQYYRIPEHVDPKYYDGYDFIENQDMRSCGLDPYFDEGDSSAEKYLCLENKGWHLKGGGLYVKMSESGKMKYV